MGERDRQTIMKVQVGGGRDERRGVARKKIGQGIESVGECSVREREVSR